MKSGTTSLFRWLGQHPEVALPLTKEPDFFTRHFDRGIDWYVGFFPCRPEHVLSGEASVSYTSPGASHLAADRIDELLPDVRLLCVLRNPLERARSHYRHEVQRGRESRPFRAALGQPSNTYIQFSQYSKCLRPYVGRFEDRLLILRFESLFDPYSNAWDGVLDFLGLPEVAAPSGTFNRSESKPRFSRLMKLVWRSQWARRISKSVPVPLRRVVRPAFLRSTREYRHLIEDSYVAPFPVPAEASIWADVEELESLVNDGRQLWRRD